MSQIRILSLGYLEFCKLCQRLKQVSENVLQHVCILFLTQMFKRKVPYYPDIWSSEHCFLRILMHLVIWAWAWLAFTVWCTHSGILIALIILETSCIFSCNDVPVPLFNFLVGSHHCGTCALVSHPFHLRLKWSVSMFLEITPQHYEMKGCLCSWGPIFWVMDLAW